MINLFHIFKICNKAKTLTKHEPSYNVQKKNVFL